jgi:glycosyltransferase involved in cell wall biosynthesis
MKYPFILFFRDDKYKYIDNILTDNSSQLNCTLHIINKKEKLNKFFKQIYPFLIVFGETKEEYNDDLVDLLNSKLYNRIIYISDFISVDDFNELVNSFYIDICSLDRIITQPEFSIFTPSFNSFEKIIRAFNSLKSQTLTNWEWVIIDDSPDDKNFTYLRKHLTTDSRVRIYRRFENNGYIGNVKNEAVSLCRGQYVLELDHDDEILPFVLKESAELFDNNSEVGFIYMDFINLYENGSNFWYGNHLCKGYGSYYCQKYDNKWVYVYITPNINNITLSHLVCCPNHPRIWRKDVLLKIGNYCEYLPICDDYEIILRTALNTKIAKIHKMGYIQYMNNENNNFSLIRNAEINRIGPEYISPIYYKRFDIHNEMKKLDAYEDEKYVNDNSIIWQRDPQQYKHKFCNLLVNNDYKQQFCIIGLDGLLKNIDRITELYKDTSNDFIVIENKCTMEYLWKRLDALGFDRMKCFLLMDEPEDKLIKYFEICYLSTNNYEIITTNINKLKYNTSVNERHIIINVLTKPHHNYLEIGIENGHTFSKTHFLHKVGVDPDPKCEILDNVEIHKCTSDHYFNSINISDSESVDSDDCIENIKPLNFDVIFIDGMHHCENVLRDFNNSINVLTKDGTIFVDDCIPLNYNEQLKIPIRHYYENNILKYGEEWTGDVWKFVYHLLKNYKDKITVRYFHNINYRGIVRIQIKEQFQVIVSYDQLNNYNYFENFNDYLLLLLLSS